MMSAKPNNHKLLIIDDNPADQNWYLRLLEDVDKHYTSIECADSVQAAMSMVDEQTSCCLLDYNLPDGNALDVLEQLTQKFGDVICPIIVITGENNTQQAVKLLQQGAQDYLVKSELTSHVLSRTIDNATENWDLKRQLHNLAHYDSLTHLTNRGLFIEKLRQIMLESERYQHAFSLVLIDLDRFKYINDIYGHQAGDHVLCEVGKKLKSVVRVSDVVGRLGGDEFALILPESDEQATRLVVQNISEALTFDVIWKQSNIPVAPSSGVTLCSGKKMDYQNLMQEADMALYKAKQEGRGNLRFYVDHWNESNEREQSLRQHLPDAIANGQLQIAAQPIVESGEIQKIKSLEILVRWYHQDTWVNPEKIIELVMALGLDYQFHSWLFNQSFSLLNTFSSEHPELGLNINLPANLCHNHKLSRLLTELVQSHQLEPRRITLEVTETHLMTEPDAAKARLLELVQNGFQIAIDDFGTGYSSLEYLADLPCSVLKIDKKFLLNIQSGSRYYNIVEAIIGLAHGLDMQVVAEGIETQDIAKTAKELGCDYLQGYHIGFPVIPEGNFAQFLQQTKHLPTQV